MAGAAAHALPHCGQVFFCAEAALDEFRGQRREGVFTPAKPISFCQWEIAPRMKGQTVLAQREHLGCRNAAYVLGWRPFDASEVKSHAKYTRDLEQAERFLLQQAAPARGGIARHRRVAPGRRLLSPRHRPFLCGQHAGLSPGLGLHGGHGCASPAALHHHELVGLRWQCIHPPTANLQHGARLLRLIQRWQNRAGRGQRDDSLVTHIGPVVGRLCCRGGRPRAAVP
jgi:hypothetical protein